MSGGVVFVVTLKPMPGTNGIIGLRSLLKAAGRRYQLPCLEVRMVARMRR